MRKINSKQIQGWRRLRVYSLRLFLSERAMLFAVVLNAALIYILSFPIFVNNSFLVGLDHFFLLFFLVELVVKWRFLGKKKYFSSFWNRFDFFIVLLSAPSILVSLVNIPNTSILILFRLFRLVRMVRLLRFVPNIEHITQGLARSFKASIFIFIGLLALNIFFSIFTCQLYHEIAPELFGDPFIASYTIFQMFTIEGWNDIPQIIATRLDSDVYVGLTRIYFVFVVISGGIFGMSLANAVFVDEMTMDNNQELEEKIDRLHEMMLELKEKLDQQDDKK